MQTVLRKAKMFALFLALTAGLAYTTVTLDLFGINRRKFSSEAWLVGDSRIRGQMARNLISSNALKGISRTDVIKLLGSSDGHKFLPTLVYKVDQGYDWLLRPRTLEVVVRFDK